MRFTFINKRTDSMMSLFKGLYESLLTESKADEQKLITFAGEDIAKRFLAIRNRFKPPQNDLYFWIKNKTAEELEQAIVELENSKSNSQQRKSIKDGAKLVGENKYWKVYHITTFEASQYYGRDTQWCITGVNGYGDTYWKSYTDKGIKFYFYITKGRYDHRGTNSKFAIAITSNGDYEIYNQQDDKVDYIPNAPIMDKIPDRVSLDTESYINYTYTGGQIPVQVRDYIETVVIDDSVTEIAEHTFHSCTSLHKVTMGNSITKIGWGAFGHCESLEDIVLSKRLTVIDNDAFNGCVKLKNITLPDGLQKIGSGAFFGCSYLKSVIIPDSVTIIDSRAFSKCYGLESVKLSNNIEGIEHHCFDSCKSLKSIVIPEKVCCISSHAFSQCEALETVKLPERLEVFEFRAFYKCSKLKNINIPDSVRDIDVGVFDECRMLADENGFVILQNKLYYYYGESPNIVIPDGVKIVFTEAFVDHLPDIKTITIPESVTGICWSNFFDKIRINEIPVTFKIKKGSYAHSYLKGEGFSLELTESKTGNIMKFRLVESLNKR